MALLFSEPIPLAHAEMASLELPDVIARHSYRAHFRMTVERCRTENASDVLPLPTRSRDSPLSYQATANILREDVNAGGQQ